MTDLREYGDIVRERHDADVEGAWRDACQRTYMGQIRGKIAADDDRNAPYRERVAREAATRDDVLNYVSRKTGVDPWTLRREAEDAAYRHGRDPGTDYDPDRFAPLDWARYRRPEPDPEPG